mgnify:CR=1 FL=1
MLKTILYNLLKRLKLFLTNKTNNEFLSKLYTLEIHKKLKELKVNQYALGGFKVYSQNEEDGIIESIFSDIGIENKIFCEIGIGDCIENNTHYLLLKGWKGLWVDSRKKYINKLKNKINKNQTILDFKTKIVTKENINHIISESFIFKENQNKEIDFFSIDIDSYDIDCLSSLVFLKPRLICIEYNAKFNQNINLEINKLNNFKWEYDDYFGSSLRIINQKLEDMDYVLIATNITGSNAFFVKKKLVKKCKTQGQTLEQLFSPPNFELFNYNVAHAPSNKYLIDILNEKKNIISK